MASRKAPAQSMEPVSAPGAPLPAGSAFSGVEGQNTAVGVLTAALHNDRLSHAWLFLGPEGVGREMAARRLAAALMCTGRAAGSPADQVCGACSACARVDRGLHPDVHLLLSEADAVKRGRISWTEDRRPAADIKVDQVRTLRDALRMTAFEGGWRVAIIPQADRLRVEAANALLKTLEEPLPRSLLVLCAPEASSVLETLLSRCQRLAFAPLAEPLVRELLVTRHGMDGSAAAVLAGQSEGSMGLALRLEAGHAQALAEAAAAVCGELERAGPADLLNRAEALDKDRDALDGTLRALARLCLKRAEAGVVSGATDGAQALAARQWLGVAEGALVLRADVQRPGANARLGLERFLLQAQARLKDSRTAQ